MGFDYKKFEYEDWDKEGKYANYTEGQSAIDATNALNAHNANQPGDWVMGTDATKAQTAMNNHIANNKPGAFNFQWQNQLNDTMNKILNREDFSYDFNQDALYQQYKDKYTKQGKMAMADTMGQAAAMTGGYGSSYASTAGNQAYQASLENLNDVIPELYQMAYDRYNQKGQDLYNQYALLSDRENTEYGRHRDKVSDYYTNRDYLTNAYYNERNFDYGMHRDKVSDWQTDRSYLAGRADSERAFDYNKWNDAKTFDYNSWNDNRTLAYNEHTNSETYRYNNYLQEEAKKQAEESAKYGVAQGGTMLYQDDPDDILGGEDGKGDGYTADQSHFDENGIYKKATYSRTDKDGNVVWMIGGKEVVRQAGANPYTGEIHPDAKHGTFSNGYQPNNIGGKPLKKTDERGTMNGVDQTIWKTPDGQKWIWDGSHNRYVKV